MTGSDRHDVEIQETLYRGLPTSRYRVWCLEKLQEQYRSLDDQSRARVDTLCGSACKQEPLFDEVNPNSGYDHDRKAPFGKSIPVFPDIRG